MTKYHYIGITCAVFVIGLLIHFNPGSFGSTSLNQRRNLKEIGTASAPLNLTSNFADAAAVSSTAVNTKGLNTLVVGGTYLTKNQISSLTMRLQASLDDGTTYYDYAVLQQNPSYGSVSFPEAGTASSTLIISGATSTAGVPFSIGGQINTSGTTFSFLTPPIPIAADFIKVTFQESTTGTHGKLHSQVFLTN